MDESLRYFLKRGLRDFLVESAAAFQQEYKTEEEKKAEDLEQFFSSDEACQALLSEYSLEDLQRDAERIGIDPAGHSKRELAKLLFLRSAGR